MQTPLSAASFFIEARYYSSGLKIAQVGGMSRPDWVPKADSVGYLDEFPIVAGDYVLEFRRILVGKKRVTWIGYFTSSTDHLGDRNQYAGIGVWILEQTILYPIHFLDPLRGWCAKIAEEGYTGSLDTVVSKYWFDYLPAYFVPTDTTIPHLKGIPYKREVVCDSIFFQCLQKEDAARTLDLAAAIINASQALKPLCETSRFLIHILSNEHQRSDSGNKEPLPEASSLLLSVIEGSREAWKSSKDDYFALGNQTQKLKQDISERLVDINELKNEGARLESELNESVSREEVLAKKLHKLESAPETNISRELAEIKRMLQIAQFRPAYTSPPPTVAKGTSAASNESNLINIIYIGFILLVILLIGFGLGWLSHSRVVKQEPDRTAEIVPSEQPPPSTNYDDAKAYPTPPPQVVEQTGAKTSRPADVNSRWVEDNKKDVYELLANAERGDANAQYAVGEIYEKGVESLPKDHTQAYKWYLIAAKNKYKNGEIENAQKRLKSKLTPKQITEAEKMANKFKPKE